MTTTRTTTSARSALRYCLVSLLFAALQGPASGQTGARQDWKKGISAGVGSISFNETAKPSEVSEADFARVRAAVYQLVPGAVVDPLSKELPLTPLSGSLWDVCPGQVSYNGKEAMSIGSACTAFLYDKKDSQTAFFITAGHCVERLIEVRDSRQYSSGELWLAQSGKAVFAVDDIGFLDGLDIAFLTVRAAGSVNALSRGTPNSDQSSKRVFTAHYPLGIRELQITVGNTGPNSEEAELPTLPGSSGAPIMTFDGNVMGVAIAGGRTFSPSTRIGDIPSGYCMNLAPPAKTRLISTKQITEKLKEINDNLERDGKEQDNLKQNRTQRPTTEGSTGSADEERKAKGKAKGKEE